jgi:hypothetical protein
MARMGAGSYGDAECVGCVAAMSLTVVGSIAFDAVKTPFGARERMLGGAILPHPRVLMRNIFPDREEYTTKAHQDFW